MTDMTTPHESDIAYAWVALSGDALEQYLALGRDMSSTRIATQDPQGIERAGTGEVA
jgi:hypothetical protein